MTDVLRQGRCERAHVRVVTADVTMLAKALQARHLAGPVAGRVLAEGLAGVALLSADLSRPEETVYIRLKVSGPLEGMMVEAAGNGDLRGFPNKKVLDALDGGPVIASAPALGEAGSAQIVQSLPGRVLNQSMLKVGPPRVDQLLARYFFQSLQVPTAVAIVVRADSGGVAQARAAMAQRMPDTRSADFEKVLEAFNDGRVAAVLAGDASLEGLREVLALPDLAQGDARELRFRCRCSQERVEAAVGALPRQELEELLALARPHAVTCHMCGRDYQLGADSLRRLLDAKGADRAEGTTT